MKLSIYPFVIALAVATAVPSSATSTPYRNVPLGQSARMEMANTSGMFKGIEVNGGSVTLMKDKMGTTLKLSSDFKVPNSPAPHWQVVDAQGNTFLLKQMRIKDGVENRMLTLPGYIKSVAKVQVWCSFAEVNLGEASFAKPVKVN